MPPASSPTFFWRRTLRRSALRGVATLAVGVLPWLPATTPATLASPAAQLAPSAQGSGIRAVETGYGFLLDRYAQAVEPAPLIQAAWDGALEAAPEHLRAAVPSSPFVGDRQAVLAEFRNRFAQLVAAGADADALGKGANRAMARSLDDCHTRFAPSYEKEIASYDGGERYGGIGASALDASRFDPQPPGPVVVGLVDGGPAAVAGLRLGDAIVGVDDTDTHGWSNSRVVEIVRGAAGTPVRLRVERPGVPQPLEITVERSEIVYNLVESRFLGPQEAAGWLAAVSSALADPATGAESASVTPVSTAAALIPRAGDLPPIGYIQLKGFARSVEPVLPQTFDALREQGARAWVLDLRNNGGGSVPTFAAVASLFIKDGTLGVTTDRSGGESYITAVGTQHKPYAQPLAVLVNSLSASASELLAADVQEYGAGRVFGEPTAGCFGNSQLFRLPDGSAMWITVRALQSGLQRRDVHKQGVTPDEVVGRSRADLASGRDPQLAAALAWLASASGVAAAGAAGAQPVAAGSGG
jgi:C-terminal processing protease CtpA/Prc